MSDEQPLFFWTHYEPVSNGLYNWPIHGFCSTQEDAESLARNESPKGTQLTFKQRGTGEWVAKTHFGNWWITPIKALDCKAIHYLEDFT